MNSVASLINGIALAIVSHGAAARLGKWRLPAEERKLCRSAPNGNDRCSRKLVWSFAWLKHTG